MNIPSSSTCSATGKRRASRSSSSGYALDPICGTTLGGVENIDPSLSGIFRAGTTIADLNNTNSRCELTGEPIFQVNRDPNLAEEDQMHFNPNAFRRPLPNGNGRQPRQRAVGVLRHPGFSNWDFTLSRRFRLGWRANLRVQLQVYNLFNQVEFIALNADYLFGANGVNTSPDTGKYTTTTNPTERRTDDAVRLLSDERGRGVRGKGQGGNPSPLTPCPSPLAPIPHPA